MHGDRHEVGFVAVQTDGRLAEEPVGSVRIKGNTAAPGAEVGRIISSCPGLTAAIDRCQPGAGTVGVIPTGASDSQGPPLEIATAGEDDDRVAGDKQVADRRRLTGGRIGKDRLPGISTGWRNGTQVVGDPRGVHIRHLLEEVLLLLRVEEVVRVEAIVDHDRQGAGQRTRFERFAGPDLDRFMRFQPSTWPHPTGRMSAEGGHLRPQFQSGFPNHCVPRLLRILCDLPSLSPNGAG